MTPQDLKERIENIANVLADKNVSDRIATIATLKVEATMKRRIFDKGTATDGTQIGKYSDKPIYVNPFATEGLPKFKPQGKNGLGKFQNGRAKVTRYFGGGYKEYRGAVGRQNQTVDLNLTSSLFLSFKTGVKNGAVVLGFNNREKGDLMRHHEDRYRKAIATPNNDERNIAFEVARDEILDLIEIQ